MQRISSVVKETVGGYIPSSGTEERKIELLDNLSIAVEKTQNEFDNPLHKKIVTDGRTAKYLCNSLEDIFQHGLREKQLSIIQTDANRCRAWIKMKLTDHTIGSYIGLLTEDHKILRDFYNSSAFLRDSVKVESVKTLLQYVIANFDFQINVEGGESISKTPSPSSQGSPVPVVGDTSEALNDEPIRRRRSSKKRAKTPTNNIVHIKDFETASNRSSLHSSQDSLRSSSRNSPSLLDSNPGYSRTLSIDSYSDLRREQSRFEKQPRSQAKFLIESPVPVKQSTPLLPHPRERRAEPEIHAGQNNRPTSLDISQTGGLQSKKELSEENKIEIRNILSDLQQLSCRPLPVEKILEVIPHQDGLTDSELKNYLNEYIANYYSLGIISNKSHKTTRHGSFDSRKDRASEKTTTWRTSKLDSATSSTSTPKSGVRISRSMSESFSKNLRIDQASILFNSEGLIDGTEKYGDKTPQPGSDDVCDSVNEADVDNPLLTACSDSEIRLSVAKDDNEQDNEAGKHHIREDEDAQQHASVTSAEDDSLRHVSSGITRENDIENDNDVVDPILPEKTLATCSASVAIDDVNAAELSLDEIDVASERDLSHVQKEANSTELPGTGITEDSDFNFVPGIYEEPKCLSKTRPILSQRSNTIGGLRQSSIETHSVPSRSLGNSASLRSTKIAPTGTSDSEELLYGFMINSPSQGSPHSSVNTTQGLIFDDDNCVSDSTETFDSTETDEKEQIRNILADLGVNDDIIGLKEDHFATPDSFMGFTSGEELQNAIETCKERVKSLPVRSNDRKQLVRKLVQLRLKLHEQKEAPSESPQHVKKVLGHEFARQGKASANYFCDCCGSTIWALMHTLYKCIACSFYCHKKCLNSVDKPCVSKKVSGSLCITEIAPECGMSTQQYRCADCRRRFVFRDGYFQARLCDYTGQFYCSNCHWNETQLIPARVIHNWDFMPRKVSRQSKHLLKLLATKPIVCLKEINPALFNFVEDLRDVRALREQILSMKSYLVACRLAVDEKLLLLLKDRQHFVENSDMYTLLDLNDVFSGELLEELSRITAMFCTHIKFDCVLCQGKGFFCEVCRSDDILYPFDFSSQKCPDCQAVFHRSCLNRGNCPKCKRLAQRKEQRCSFCVGACISTIYEGVARVCLSQCGMYASAGKHGHLIEL
eukprot:gene18740-20628_t